MSRRWFRRNPLTLRVLRQVELDGHRMAVVRIVRSFDDGRAVVDLEPWDHFIASRMRLGGTNE